MRNLKKHLEVFSYKTYSHFNKSVPSTVLKCCLTMVSLGMEKKKLQITNVKNIKVTMLLYMQKNNKISKSGKLVPF